MECPVCRESMVVIEYKSIELDYCVGCMGVWFDGGEIELLLETAGVSVPPNTIVFTDAQSKTREISRPCPLCRAPMDKVSPPGSTVILDQCPDGDGIWFDAGETAQAVKDFTGNNSNLVLNILQDFLGEALSPSKSGHA
jgi:uncharacterized protein